MKFLEIAFVGYAVTDLKRARKFYEEILELTPTSTFGDDKQGWIEYDIGTGTLAIGNGAMGWKPSPDGGSGALEVDDFQPAIDLLKRKGVPFRFEPFESPVCWMAVIADPDGNSIVIHKRKA